jgi:membrane-associated phospholipid phosphatase
MNSILSDTHAAWLAAHPALFFFWVPPLVAIIAVAVWFLKAGRPPGQQRIIYWGLVVLAVLVFAFLATALGQQGAVVQFDTALARALAVSAALSALPWLAYFTRLGAPSLLAIFAVCLMLVLLYRRRWVLAAGWVAAIAGGDALNSLLKHAFQRARPEQLQGYVTFQGWSFPSGHASAAMAAYGMLCYLALRLLPAPWRGVGVFVAVWLITAIGVSRVILQAHYLSDVVAGFAITFAWLAVCIAVTESGLRRRAASL